MVDRKLQETDSSVLEFIIREGSTNAQQALDELSGRALGGNKCAQDLIKELDIAFLSGKITIPDNKIILKPEMSGFLHRIGNALNRQSDHYLPPDRDP